MPETRAETEAKAIAFAMELEPIIAEMMSAGTTSNAGIAKKLNLRGVTTQRGGIWTNVQVCRLRARINSGKPD